MTIWRSRRVWSFLSWAPVAYCFFSYGYALKRVSGRSMQPTLNPEPCISPDLVLFNRLPMSLGTNFERGDVVALRSPTKPGSFVVKRVIGLPGETVKTLPPYPEPEVIVPPGHVWLEGDEPFYSIDSNTWGPVAISLLDAKIQFVLWPPNRFGWIEPRTPRPVTDALNATNVAWKKELGDMAGRGHRSST